MSRRDRIIEKKAYMAECLSKPKAVKAKIEKKIKKDKKVKKEE